MEFPLLFSPVRIGNVTIRNRILSTGHLTHFAGVDGMPTQRLIDYHVERAKGGIGLVVTESMSVHPTSWHSPYVIHLWDDRVVPKLRELVSSVKEHGATIFCQLHHAGHRQLSVSSRMPVPAPSEVLFPDRRETPHVLTPKEIKDLVKAFGDAAERAVAAGYDGMEVHLAHGYLLGQFLSPWSNRRTDEYGGSLENRMRFPREVLREVVRRAPGLPVGVRLNGDDFKDGSNNADDLREIALALEKEGLAYIGLSVGRPGYFPNAYPSMHYPLGPFVYLAAALKEKARVPVYTSHRIKDPQQAETILQSGHADMVAMTRALIADPELPNKARRGRTQAIRPCIGCLQACAANLRQRVPIGCFTNPAVGREAEFALQPAFAPKKVTVVGGGPAGAEAALVAAQRGHVVQLYEAAEKLGGKLHIAAKLPGREELLDFVRWQEAELKRLHVPVHLNARFTLDNVVQGGFDCIIVATGATYGRPTWLVPTVPHYNIEEAIDLQGVEGKRFLVIDEDYHNKALHVGELLAERGSDVTLFAADDLAVDLDPVNKTLALDRAKAAGVRFISKGTILGFSGRTAHVTHEGWELTLRELDGIVVVQRPVAEDSLYREVQQRFPEVNVRVIGHAAAPRLTHDAIFDAYRVALEI